jgi:hypothetical protein
MRATCPTCNQAVEGTMAELTKHVKQCGKTTKARLVERHVYDDCTPALERLVDAELRTLRINKLKLPMEFQLTTAVPSQNTAGHSQQWYGYHKIRKQWRQIVQYHMAPVRGMQFQWSRWHFLRLVPPRGKFYDGANFVGGCKAPVDGLTFNRVIVDDADQFFKADYEQQRLSEWSQTHTTSLLGVRTIITLLEAR